MTHDITIPLKAVGAAAVNVAALLDWHDWLSMDEADRALCRRIATAALRAGIAAWPGMFYSPGSQVTATWFDPGKIILPTPTENTNAEA